jgi:hypothetical protein
LSENIYQQRFDNLKKAKSSASIAEASGEIEKLRTLARKMKDSLSIRKRISSFKLYARTFVGFRAVEWLMKENTCNLQQALAIGNRMLNWGLIHHVGHEHLFHSRNIFYQFSVEIDPQLGSSIPIIPSDLLEIQPTAEDTHQYHSPHQKSFLHSKQEQLIKQYEHEFKNITSVLSQISNSFKQVEVQNSMMAMIVDRHYKKEFKMLRYGYIILLILLTILCLSTEVDPLSSNATLLAIMVTLCVVAILFTAGRRLTNIKQEDIQRYDQQWSHLKALVQKLSIRKSSAKLSLATATNRLQSLQDSSTVATTNTTISNDLRKVSTTSNTTPSSSTKAVNNSNSNNSVSTKDEKVFNKRHHSQSSLLSPTTNLFRDMAAGVFKTPPDSIRSKAKRSNTETSFSGDEMDDDDDEEVIELDPTLVDLSDDDDDDEGT